MKKILASLIAFAFLCCMSFPALAAQTNSPIVVDKTVTVVFAIDSIIHLSDKAISAPQATYQYTLTAATEGAETPETIYGMQPVVGQMDQEQQTAQVAFTAMNHADQTHRVKQSVLFNFEVTFSDAGVYHYCISEDSGTNSKIINEPKRTKDVYFVVGYAEPVEGEIPHLVLEHVLMYDVNGQGNYVKSEGFTHSYGIAPNVVIDTDGTPIYTPGAAGSLGQDFCINLKPFGDLADATKAYTITLNPSANVTIPDGTAYAVSIDTGDEAGSGNYVNDPFLTSLFAEEGISSFYYDPTKDCYVADMLGFDAQERIYWEDGQMYSAEPMFDELTEDGMTLADFLRDEVGLDLNEAKQKKYAKPLFAKEFVSQEGFSCTLTEGQRCTIYSVDQEFSFTASIAPATDIDEEYTLYARPYQWGSAEITAAEDHTGAPAATGATAAVVTDKNAKDAIAYPAQRTNWEKLDSTHTTNATQDPYVFAVDNGTWYQDNGGVSFAFVRGGDDGKPDDPGIEYDDIGLPSTGINLTVMPYCIMVLLAAGIFAARVYRGRKANASEYKS